MAFSGVDVIDAGKSYRMVEFAFLDDCLFLLVVLLSLNVSLDLSVLINNGPAL